MRVLFLGEGELAGPARYLASVLRWAEIPFDHRPDRAKIPKTWRKPGRYGVILLSDYRHSSFTVCSREWLTCEVTQRGTGLIMIGGWASFTGLVGGYAGTALERLLPVHCVPGDDRVNWAAGSVVSGVANPPIVCGYHRAIPKKGSQTLLSLRDLKFSNGRPQLGRPHPLLVTGFSGEGRTAAFLTDCAPHWAGGLVDWGRKRVTVRVNAAISTEVGDTYLKFFSQLIRWAGKKSDTPL
jgi:uncharacterized membrane protein